MKRIRVVPPKTGRLYPTLSDIESAHTESDPEYTTASVSDEGEHFFREKQPKVDKTTEDEDDDRYDKLIDLFLFCFCAN